MHVTCDSTKLLCDFTAQEMDLIEILWKQDIDLGVTRDAYDSRQPGETDKLKDVEFLKEKDLLDQKDLKVPEEPVIVPDPLAGLNYTIDSETGEYVIDDFSSSFDNNVSLHHFQKNESFHDEKSKPFESELLAKEVDSLNSFDLDAFLPFEDNDFCDLTELFPLDELSDLIPDDLASNPNYSLPQIVDVEKEFEQFGILNEENIDDADRGEMYPNIENCWPDATSMMPLFAVGTSYPSSLTPNQSTTLSSPARASSEAQTSILTSDADFQAVSPSMGSSSIGYAVAESIATLTNDSDPTPVSSIVNNAYGEDLPELLYANHTITVPHNDLISELFLDDINLMPLPANDNSEKAREDQMDTSNDSVSSSNFPSVPDCRDWIDSCSESSMHNEEDQTRCDLLMPHSQIGYLSPSQNSDPSQASASPKKFRQSSRNQNGSCMNSLQAGNCNDQQYFTLKSYYSDPSENSACAISCSVMNFNKKFDYSVPKANGYNCSNFLQHNHTYHIPFNNDDLCHKPITRDKQRSYSDDDSSNKDEKRAKELKLPISISDIINLAIEEYNERLSKYELTEAQITLIRDIRRRGKNKVAAQNCRKRKMDQINNLQQDLDYLQDERMKLKSKQNHLLQQKHAIEEKYVQLHDLILQNTNCRPPSAPSLSAFHNSQNATSDTMLGNTDSNVNGGAKTKKKFKK
ncbi:endoplasmic reticulum membrane sensor NFE2L1 isoform X2 [Parasteatoda tepidariorum]|nr:endoplasmic reticulum membrane sensor NFE2L1 isoform X2 [Parasteatoda tepidariorum]